MLEQRGREVEVFVNGNVADVMDRLRAQSPESLSTESLTLEEIFVATLEPGRWGHDDPAATRARREELRALGPTWLARLPSPHCSAPG